MRWLASLRYGPLTRDRCEVCGKPLRVKERREVTAVFAPTVEEGIFGGGSVSATYCGKDVPAETEYADVYLDGQKIGTQPVRTRMELQ